MRAMWRGAISFGLVTIAVKLYAATEEHDFRFHQVHREDGGRIRYKRVCSACGKEIDYADIDRGYELEDGRLVTLSKQDFESLPITTDRAIEVLEFVSAEQIDPIFFQKSYYLEPDKAAVRPYVLLRTALEQAGRLAVVKITLRQRETLAMLRAREDVLVLHTMMWPDEVRVPEFPFLHEDTEVRRQELQMAGSLVESMSGDFHPEEFTDDYRVALQELIEARAEGATPPRAGKPDKQAEVVDLMSALQRSVEAAGGKRKTTSRAKPAAKKTTRTRTTTKSSSATKSGSASSTKSTAAKPRSPKRSA
ncbi:non-homologous end joining protein Ku [Crossiella sp. CA198]|uniref:non-homologous end joining protein Ku n=1 Tax=Crossiella sp. CA198 TaxID=3455607 RepID=UPI003F8D24C7